VRPNDSKELAKMLDYVIANHKKLGHIRRHAREEARTKYDAKEFLKQYERLY